MELLETPVPISQYDDEFLLLLGLYRKRSPRFVLEIGTHHGGTLYHWVTKASRYTSILSIDDQHINKNLYREWASGRVSVDWYHGDSTSREIINSVRRYYAPFDWIFIDGDHSYKGVKSDWDNYRPMMAPGGIVAFHDITPHPHRKVDKLWNEIKHEYNTQEIIGATPYPDQCGIGVVYFD